MKDEQMLHAEDFGSTAGLGLLREKRRVLRADANVAIWGCIVSGNIWSASDGGPAKFVMGALWLVFAGLFLWIERDAR